MIAEWKKLSKEIYEQGDAMKELVATIFSDQFD
jgi:hypothetical protein